MARDRRRSDSAIKERVRMELTPMIDVTFLILIFFMCTLKFKRLEMKMVSYLPTEQGLTRDPDRIPREDAEVVIRVPRSEWGKEDPLARTVQFVRGRSNEVFGECRGITIGEDGRVAAFDLVPPDTFDRILGHLRAMEKGVPGARARIHCRSRAPHLYVVKVMDLMKMAEFEHVTYSGIPSALTRKLESGEVR